MNNEEELSPRRGESLEHFFVEGRELLRGKLHIMEFRDLISLLRNTNDPVDVKIFTRQSYSTSTTYMRPVPDILLDEIQGYERTAFFSDHEPNIALTPGKLLAEFGESEYAATINVGKPFVVTINTALRKPDVVRIIRETLGEVPVEWVIQFQGSGGKRGKIA